MPTTIRHKMRLALVPQAVSSRRPARPIEHTDILALATLMFKAYRGTLDDEGGTVDDAREEVERTFDGAYGDVLPGCSFAVEEDGRMLAATLVTHWQDAPLLAFVMTHPDAKGQGLATYLIRHSINRLFSQGYDELYLFVTEGNAPAQRIYDRLGFAVVATR